MSQQIIGAAVPRIDGPDKLTGRARYTAHHYPTDMAYGYGVFSQIASGTITHLDLDEAKRSPGVIDIFHHGHFPKLHRTPSSFAEENKVDETRLPFEDETIYYAGQFVALVVADTFENARAAAYRVKVDYDEQPATANLDQGLNTHGATPAEGSGHSRGDAASAFDSAPHKIEATYGTPVQTHNPMEMHATVANWDNDHLIVHEASQGVVFARNVLAKVFDIPSDKVEVHSKFIGSGFGSKLWIWPHAVAAAAAAREIGRPVQLVVPRQQVFTTTGPRPQTRQHMRLAADDNGRLVSLRHESISTTSPINTFVEACGGATTSLYNCDNLLVSHATIPVNCGTPTSMRAPGAGSGMFALESAIDEIAEAVGMDPVEFRRRNYTDTDQSKNLPFSSNHLLEAYDEAARKFGWSERNPEVGSMRQGHKIIGWGMAACNWGAMKMHCDARVSLRADGTVLAACGTQDIGTGTYTIVAQAVSSIIGVPIDRIEVELGDSSYPSGPISGGSWATATTLPAIAQAARAAIDRIKEYAIAETGAFAGASADDLNFEDGQIKNADGTAVAFSDILERQMLASADGEAHTPGASDDYSFQSFGAHFVEITWDPGISELRVTRVVSAIDVGQVINAKTARSQVEGAIVMGLGAACFEGTEYDHRDARPVNGNYAEYLVPVHADQPDVDVILLDYPDYAFNEFGARGIGEIGITGITAAVANAVYHATGIRVRELPVSIDKLMTNA